ncbi:MAG: hypothetical protein GX931_04815 [Acholeplasmataceae bacterium]|nr:hypothetical protein [Acholeplasmataceae bacterium]
MSTKKEVLGKENRKEKGHRRYSLLLLALLFIGFASYGTYAVFTGSKSANTNIDLSNSNKCDYTDFDLPDDWNNELDDGHGNLGLGQTKWVYLGNNFGSGKDGLPAVDANALVHQNQSPKTYMNSFADAMGVNTALEESKGKEKEDNNFVGAVQGDTFYKIVKGKYDGNKSAFFHMYFTEKFEKSEAVTTKAYVVKTDVNNQSTVLKMSEDNNAFAGDIVAKNQKLNKGDMYTIVLVVRVNDDASDDLIEGTSGNENELNHFLQAGNQIIFDYSQLSLK